MANRLIKNALLLSVAASGIAAATPALAQDSAGATASGDIIVTARRVEERLQDVPISITVYNQDELTKRNITVATDLATYTPSLSVNERYGPEKASFSLRGFNQDQSTAPTVGVYFAEVVGVRAQGGTTSGNSVGAGAFMDLENVQVLKGPQGTLFGRNTTGGAILLTPKKPTDNLEGYIEGTYGNYDQVRVQGALNVPLADTFKVRVAVDRNKRDGYMRNLSDVGPKAYNDRNYLAARLSILAELTPDLENYTIFHYSDSDTNGYAARIVGCSTAFAPNAGTSGIVASACADQVARQNARGDSLYDVESSNRNPFLKIKQWQVINTTTWQASDTLTVKNIMSYGEFEERANFDLYTSNFTVSNVTTPGYDLPGFYPNTVSPLIPAFINVPPGTPFQYIVLDTADPVTGNSSQSTFTEELQLQFDSVDGRFNGVLGGYLEFSRPLGFNGGRTGIYLNCVRPQNLECQNPLLFGSISESHTKLNFDNHGIFAQGTYNFTDQLSLTAGVRYTFDKIAGLQDSTRAGFSANAGTGPLFPDPLTGVMIARACTDSFRHGPAQLAADGLPPPAADRSVCTTRLTNKSNKPTWLINADYKITPDLMVYAKYARGYRQGGINFTNPGVELWGPESLDSYEVGVKSSFRGAVSGYFNVTGFYNDLKDMQVFAGLVSDTPGVAGGAAILNAGSAESYGVEVDGSIAVLDNSLRFDLGYTYLHTEVKDVEAGATKGDGSRLGDLLVGTPFGAVTPTVSPGSQFTLSPKHKLTATATYTLPLDASIGDISIGATWVHTGKQISNGSVPAVLPDGTPLGSIPSYDLLNLNLDWKSVAGSPIDLAVFATNVTKEVYPVNTGGGWNSSGIGDWLLGVPRMYGVRVRYNFGQ
ncbi:MAG: TonB-dependent receptor [Novosphingobium sp.]|nr:TonB-dependent receptor [Novosphingobium sp.]MCP5401265.1 TonB-dependent receptor [Novosphingobium sp.]